MKYFVTYQRIFSARNKSALDFVKRVPLFTDTLIPDDESLQQLISTVRNLMEDQNDLYKSCKPMELRTEKMLDGHIVITVDIPSASLRPTVLEIHLAKVAHEWNVEKGGIKW